MPENPLKVFEENDQELLKFVQDTGASAFVDGPT
jgi:hypothetical protein